MTDPEKNNSRLGPLGPVVRLGGRAAAVTLRPAAGVAAFTMRPAVGVASLAMRPLSGAASAAVEAGRGLERRAVQRVLDSPEVERLPSAALDSEWTQAAIRNALASDGAKQLVASLFESGLFDEILDRLVEREALWRMVDELASSPAVTAAITQQGLGFADQVGDVARARSRSADDWLERRARRLAVWRSKSRGPDGNQPQPAEP
jgi:hypothetical protein